MGGRPWLPTAQETLATADPGYCGPWLPTAEETLATADLRGGGHVGRVEDENLRRAGRGRGGARAGLRFAQGANPRVGGRVCWVRRRRSLGWAVWGLGAAEGEGHE